MGTKNGVGVNPSKIELVLFNRKYKIPNLKLQKLLGQTLTLSGGAKYLGVTHDRKLDWKLNPVYRANKAATALYTCPKAA